MFLNKLWGTSALAALAVALTLPALPAQAQDRENYRNRGEQMADRERAQRIDNRTERRAVQIERSGDRAARQAARQGDVQRAQRIDRQSERVARQVERRGDDRARQAAQGRDWQNRNRDGRDWQNRGRDGRDWQNQNRDGRDWQNRNRDGRDWQNRNRDGRDWNDNRGWQRNGGDYRRNRDNNWRGNNGDWRRNDRWRDSDSRYRDGRRDQRDYRQAQRNWDRRWRNDNRYDWHRYRTANRHLYSPGRYYAPYRDYSYRRLSIGFRLDNLFFGSRYQINDPWRYRLPEVYGSYRWVRYYDDALLVDVYSGEVVDVIHDFFW